MNAKRVAVNCGNCGASWSITEGEPCSLICQSCGSIRVIFAGKAQLVCQNGHSQISDTGKQSCDECPPPFRNRFMPFKVFSIPEKKEKVVEKPVVQAEKEPEKKEPEKKGFPIPKTVSEEILTEREEGKRALKKRRK